MQDYPQRKYRINFVILSFGMKSGAPNEDIVQNHLT